MPLVDRLTTSYENVSLPLAERKLLLNRPHRNGPGSGRSRYELLQTIQRQVGRERSMARLPGLVMETVGQLLDADRSTLYLLEGETMALRACYAQGVQSGSSIVVPLQMGVIGTALLRRQAINLVNASQHPFFNSAIDSVTGYKTDSLLALPIIDPSNDQVIGGIELLNKPSGHFSAEDERIAAATAQRLVDVMHAPNFNRATARAIINELHGLIEYGRGAVFCLDIEEGRLVALHADDADGVDLSINMRLGIAGMVALTNEPLLIADAQADPRFDSSFDRKTGYVTRQILCVPLLNSKNEAMGVIQVINKRKGTFSAEDRDLLTSVSCVVAIAIENAMLFEENEQQFRSLLDALAASIDARDSLTAGHSRRVAVIARGIATELDFNEQDIDLLEVAAILHDYGKIGVDDKVLKKEGRLDEDEYAHMKQHAEMSFGILDRIRFSRRYSGVPLIAASHHENLDGSGYPRGLKAHAIPFMAKILSVADVFEALTANRHYRKGMQVDRSLAIIDQEVGKKFEGLVVDALRRYLAKGGLVALDLAASSDASADSGAIQS